MNPTRLQATLAANRLVAAYELGPGATSQRWHIACLDASTGRNLWDVELPGGAAPYGGIVATDRYVVMAQWGRVDVLALATGQHVRTIGQRR